jgi:N6-adenosine-specific RNA methylase IME4
MIETPDITYGRLLESVHNSGYSFERFCSELDSLLTKDRWKQVSPGFNNINDFVATINLSQFNMEATQRKALVKKLDALKATQRPIAKALGVGKGTIDRDLHAPSGASKQAKRAQPEPASAPLGAPEPWHQKDSQEIAKREKQDERYRARDQENEQKRQANKALTDTIAPIQEYVEGEVFQTIVIDPPWDWGDEGDKNQFGVVTPTYNTMSLEELLELPIGKVSSINAHLYLWITNRSLLKGGALLERWGFRYITCLTWCKPSIGAGNYFKGQSEHILFGVRGSLPLLRNDIGTVFEAKRTGHSAKPDEFYALVEQCSPGPWLEMFSRKERPGWVTWGAEVEKDLPLKEKVCEIAR